MPLAAERRHRLVHDLVIDRARIVDGLGTPAYEGSLAVAGGRIAAVSRDPAGGELGPSVRRVDGGSGLVVGPGIVDVHTHYGRPAHLGSLRHAVEHARRHHRGDRQLREFTA
jgi:N-acyl-D-aspartate/D-glutamate deacylase